LELVLVVALRSLRLNVLLNRVDLRLILNQLLLNVVQAIVDLRLKDLIFLRVVAHRVICHLLGQTVLVGLQEGTDRGQALLLGIELPLQIIRLGELVGHIILHLTDLVGGLSHFLVDTAFKVLHFLQIIVDSLLLDTKSRSCRLRVF